MPRSFCHPPNSRDTLHFNSAVTVMRQETALPHPRHETVKQQTHGLCHTALFKLQIHLQHQQMAEKSAADLMCCLVFIMWGDTKRGMINVLVVNSQFVFFQFYMVLKSTRFQVNLYVLYTHGWISKRAYWAQAQRMTAKRHQATTKRHEMTPKICKMTI